MMSAVTFGVWLKQQRRLHHLTQQELSGKVGCAAETLRKIESDRRNPSPQLVARLLEALDVPQANQSQIIDWACTGARASVLPHHLTPILGRDQDVAAIVELLQQPHVRLVTLIGPPGVGKTRLAQAVATGIEPYLLHGVTYVPLVAVHHPDLMLSTIAHTLDIISDTRPTFDVLVEYLQKSPRLLVLDNMEHLLAAVPILHNLLNAIPALNILVTSRVVLKVAGEHVYYVAPLKLPPVQTNYDVEQLQTVPSIQLFVQRAQARNPHFSLTDTNASIITQLCAQLNGLPLALELAAMRITVLSPVGLLAHIDRQLALLRATSQDGPNHQRTLRATIDWSVALLSPAAQRLFARLSIFRGSFTYTAIETVCRAVDSTTLSIQDGLNTLVDHSLVQIHLEDSEEPRFSVLEVLREYAGEQLAATDEESSLSQQHTAYYLSLAIQSEQALQGDQTQEWLQYLEADLPNIRAALQWAKAQQQGEIGVTFLASLWRFWLMRGYLNEGRQWMDSLLTLPGKADPTIRAQAYGGAGVLAQIQGDSDKALQYHEQSLTFALEGENTQIIGRAINRLGIVWLKRQDYDKAKELFEQGLSILQDAGDTLGVAYLLNNIGNIDNEQGYLQQAQRLYRESYLLFEKEKCVDGMALSLINQGEVASLAGDDIQAHKLYSHSLTYYQALQDDRNIAICHLYLGQICYRQGDYAQSFDYTQQGLCVLYQINDLRHTLLCICLIAAIVGSTNNKVATTRLLGAVEMLQAQFGISFTSSDDVTYKQILATYQPHFNGVEWELGRSMSFEEAVTYALQQGKSFCFPKQERSLVCQHE